MLTVINVIGIRSSILELMNNICGNKVSGIGRILINSIYDWAKTLNIQNSYIRVIHPIGPMPHILQQYGFNKVGNMSDTLYWINDYLGNSLLLEKGKGVRESDYIIRIS